MCNQKKQQTFFGAIHFSTQLRELVADFFTTPIYNRTNQADIRSTGIKSMNGSVKLKHKNLINVGFILIAQGHLYFQMKMRQPRSDLKNNIMIIYKLVSPPKKCFSKFDADSIAEDYLETRGVVMSAWSVTLISRNF